MTTRKQLLRGLALAASALVSSPLPAAEGQTAVQGRVLKRRRVPGARNDEDAEKPGIRLHPGGVAKPGVRAGDGKQVPGVRNDEDAEKPGIRLHPGGAAKPGVRASDVKQVPGVRAGDEPALKPGLRATPPNQP